MKHCAYCGHVIVGEAIEISTEPANGARPTAYWHKTARDCVVAVVAEEKTTGVSSPPRRHLSRL
ncbi:hypothetical protein R1T08_17455 [Streptomyces sp. SBC-4]|nr:hypothetical protein [Streptomyces sp. SBC-4]MDV5145949.1 hypothetical protein [Streptomyces sp. SBC-4]